MKYIIITNNPLVKEKYVDKEVEFSDVSYQEILQSVKNKIALGHKILTHPLSGSVKPKETPYKSIMISKERASVDLESIDIIENAIITASKFVERRDKWTPRVLEDFKLVDFTLIDSAMGSVS
ncbi:MAG: GrdX family protein [Lachnospiraceae bacterium]|nr:GrdX family protein [Lachnospiraceae bacterium]